MANHSADSRHHCQCPITPKFFWDILGQLVDLWDTIWDNHGMKRDPEEFKQNVRRRLNELNLTQKEAAEKADLPYKWVRRICSRGLTRIEGRNAEQVKKLCDLLGIEDHEQLFSGIGFDDTPAGWAKKAAEVIRRKNSDGEQLKSQIDIAYRKLAAESVWELIKSRGLYDTFKKMGKFTNQEDGLALIRYLLAGDAVENALPLSAEQIVEKVEAKKDSTDSSSK
ncbi:helix-turn-helix domain-containing protein [Gimesia aquarii]|nr:helix-turn-helix transcriptional regulator [Gimesia aquarii]